MRKTNPASSSKGSRFEREKYLYLTTRGRRTSLPREIEIWFTHHDGRFFVVAEHPTSHWLQNLMADPEVKVRVAGESLAAQARVVIPGTEPGLHQSIQDRSRRKYGWGDGVVVELSPVY